MWVVDSWLGDCVVVVVYYCLTLPNSPETELTVLHLQLIYHFACVCLYSVHIMYNVCIHTPVAIRQYNFISHSFCCRQQTPG